MSNTSPPPVERPSKKQKREDYRSTISEYNDEAKNGGAPVLPQKKFYRQRAHANPFSDHALI
jgi:tRNA (guanine-N7-)-methyltransferase